MGSRPAPVAAISTRGFHRAEKVVGPQVNLPVA
jgi:hypothetical protein